MTAVTPTPEANGDPKLRDGLLARGGSLRQMWP